MFYTLFRNRIFRFCRRNFVIARRLQIASNVTPPSYIYAVTPVALSLSPTITHTCPLYLSNTDAQQGTLVQHRWTTMLGIQSLWQSHSLSEGTVLAPIFSLSPFWCFDHLKMDMITHCGYQDLTNAKFVIETESVSEKIPHSRLSHVYKMVGR